MRLGDGSDACPALWAGAAAQHFCAEMLTPQMCSCLGKESIAACYLNKHFFHEVVFHLKSDLV